MEVSLEFEREERELREIEKKILKTEGIRRDLDRLANAGASQTTVLRLLALAVFGHQMRWCRRVMGQKRDALRNLARQLRTVTSHAERLAADPLCGGHFWLALLGLVNWDEVKWPTKSDPRAPFGSMMRTLINHTDRKAKFLGQIMRQGAFYSRRAPIMALCYYIRKSTGHNHDDEAARLLTDAHEAVGSAKTFSAFQLQQIRKRYMRPLLGLLKQSQAPH